MLDTLIVVASYILTVGFSVIGVGVIASLHSSA